MLFLAWPLRYRQHSRSLLRSWAKQSYSYNHIVCSFVGHKNALHCLCIFCPYLEADRGAQKPTRKPDTKGQTKNLALSCTIINTSPSKFVFRGYIGSNYTYYISATKYWAVMLRFNCMESILSNISVKCIFIES